MLYNMHDAYHLYFICQKPNVECRNEFLFCEHDCIYYMCSYVNNICKYTPCIVHVAFYDMCVLALNGLSHNIANCSCPAAVKDIV